MKDHLTEARRQRDRAYLYSVISAVLAFAFFAIMILTPRPANAGFVEDKQAVCVALANLAGQAADLVQRETIEEAGRILDEHVASLASSDPAELERQMPYLVGGVNLGLMGAPPQQVAESAFEFCITQDDA